MAELTIRPMKGQAEAEECARIMATTEPWITLKRDYEASLKTVTDPSREVFVVAEGDRVRGFIILLMEGVFVGYIQSLAVAEEARGQGVGSGLMAFAEEYIFSQTPNMFICVSSFNPRARVLYERLGFELIGELKDWIVDGHGEYLLRKSLCSWEEFRKRSGQAR